ncbi:hypothetical protein HHI36_010437, partial [Cryptolaemus montrouzieri]
LKIGVMKPDFHSSGKSPLDSDELNKLHIGAHNDFAHSFRKTGLRPSDPGDFPGDKLVILFITSSTVIDNSLKIEVVT